MTTLFQQFTSRTMLLMLLTGFSSGLPLSLTASTLQAWMKDLELDLSTIGIFSLVGLPYAVKFLWAPVMDCLTPPFLGRRRGWMLITQILLAASILFLAFLDPASQLLLTALVCLLIAFLSASQDVVVDAFRTDLLTPLERGPGASVSNLGYRIAMIVSGNIALILADYLSWQQVYLLMAACMVVGMIGVIISPEPAEDEARPVTILAAYREPLQDYFSRKHWGQILSFIVLYKIDIVFATVLLTPFLLDLGFSKTEIGVLAKTIGMGAAIVGSLVGGALYTVWGLKRSLWIFGIAQGFSTLSFAALAIIGQDSTALALAMGFENFCAGLATAPFIAFMMALCNRSFSAAQYAMLSSFAALSRVLAGPPAGYLVEASGWAGYFVFCALSAIPALWLMARNFDSWLPAESLSPGKATSSS